ncbi:hypothetical protein A9Q75_19105 [Colwellia psychrerythraea]|uniref:Lipoprotein n=1 Tax=Colwellia psychrerythraea TaxID=28229 RepID=A0A1Y5DY13_COLPS|nr:hypothetical protein A9Q75_19105 [Colwellia psychrerythraea]
MKKFTPLVILCSAVVFLSFAYSPSSFAKKRCKPFLEKLHNIQTMQRKGYSLKRGESLRAKEDKAREKWWRCERSSLAKFTAQYGGKKKKTKKVSKIVKSKKYNALKNRSYYTKGNKALSNSQKNITTFNQNSAIVIRSKYQGSKQLAWSQFYSQPVKCQRPKSMSVFAYCSENKIQQQSEFDKVYRD